MFLPQVRPEMKVQTVPLSAETCTWATGNESKRLSILNSGNWETEAHVLIDVGLAPSIFSGPNLPSVPVKHPHPSLQGDTDKWGYPSAIHSACT